MALYMLSVSGNNRTGGWRCSYMLYVLRITKVIKIGLRDCENKLKFDIIIKVSKDSRVAIPKVLASINALSPLRKQIPIFNPYLWIPVESISSIYSQKPSCTSLIASRTPSHYQHNIETLTDDCEHHS